MLLSLFAVLITFGLVIFLHELGHFLVCKKMRVRVERFAFGFGPELLGFSRGETRYSLCAFPLGGFVKPAGESLEEHQGLPDEYFSQAWYKRIGIVAAGPAMNYLLAFILFTGAVYFWGQPQPSDQAIIGETLKRQPADLAGIRSGDRIRSVNGVEVLFWKDMAEQIHKNPNRKIPLQYERSGRVRKIELTPVLDPDKNTGMIGISPKMEYVPQNLLSSIRAGALQCTFWTVYTLRVLFSKIYHLQKPDVSGPIGIMQMVSRAAHSGLENMVFLIALISVAVGLFNLFPIPLLDGGHAALYLWEGIRRKKLTPKILQAANTVGFAIVIGILLFATYNDLLRLHIGK